MDKIMNTPKKITLFQNGKELECWESCTEIRGSDEAVISFKSNNREVTINRHNCNNVLWIISEDEGYPVVE